MITIKEETYNNPDFSGDISNYMLYLYQMCSTYPLPRELDIPNETWEPFINELYKCCGLPYPNYIIKRDLIKDYSSIEIDYNKVIVGLSGGKDSAGTLAILKDEGKDVTAYFLQRANLSYLNEESAAEGIAELLDVPLIKDKLYRTGKTEWFKEVPVKNQLIMARILEYGLKHNCAVISMGETVDGVTSSVANPQYDFTDNNDFTLLFEKAIQSHVPQFRYDYFLQSEATGISYIIVHHPELLERISSCMMPTRYLKQQLKYAERFHLHGHPDTPDRERLLDHRCMNCYKCLAEWLYLVLWNKIPYNKSFMEERVLPLFLNHRSELDNRLSKKDPKDITNQELLYYAIFPHDLERYTKDPNTILQDVHHRYPELVPNKQDV